MALGTNLSAGNPERILQNICMKIGAKSVRGLCLQGFILEKDGAPVDSTEADDPTKINTFIWDSSNDDVYMCTAYTSAGAFTVTKVVD